MPPHTDKTFEKDLEAIKTGLTRMGEDVATTLAHAMSALLERDARLAKKTIEGDGRIDRQELDLDERCRTTLALRQPAASDLRLITTALKSVTDLERCGDLAVNIAERALDLCEAAPLTVPEEVERMGQLAQKQLRDALESFVTADAARAEQVLAGDEMLDALFVKLLNHLLALMMEDSRTIRRATSLLFIGKHLERIGDHATNVAEMVIYMVRGTDVRHERRR
ncbi:MAG: phosphate signaling complex protein PhoU [Myxococcota bacterium]